MEFINNLTKDIDSLFEELSHNMSGTNYCVVFEAKTFQYCNNINFTLELLKKLYEGETRLLNNVELSIEGPINEIDFKLAKQDIEECIKSTYDEDFGAYRDVLGTYTGWAINSEIAKQRLDTFWGIINAHFTMPPTHCFEHKPEHDSFFGGGVMWEFCYILLNDNTKEGIVIAGQAYD